MSELQPYAVEVLNAYSVVAGFILNKESGLK